MSSPPLRAAGWVAAGGASVALLSGAALALTLAQRPEAAPLMLTLAPTPPVGLSVSALPDPAPTVADEAPDLPNPEAEKMPAAPRAVTAAGAESRPTMTQAALPAPPLPDAPPQAEMSLPAPPQDPVSRPRPRPDPKPERQPQPRKAEASPGNTPAPREVPPGTKAETARLLTQSSAASSAPTSAAKADGGQKTSPAAYARAVMKKVRETRTRAGAGKGTVVVGFTIATDGGLASVRVLKSSGNARLDDIAIDHIRRSAPFPPPPATAATGFSFEFVGR